MRHALPVICRVAVSANKADCRFFIFLLIANRLSERGYYKVKHILFLLSKPMKKLTESEKFQIIFINTQSLGTFVVVAIILLFMLSYFSYFMRP